MEKQIEDYLKTVAAFAAAEVREAEEFMRFKTLDDKCTDGRAERMAKIATDDLVVRLAAQVIVKRLLMERASRGVVEPIEERLN